MLTSVVWTLLVALVLAAVALVVMVVRRRPEQGWGTWLRANLATQGGERTSILTEHREAADGDTVSLVDILADAEHAPGYVTVPEAIEHRLETIAEPIEHGIGALSDRVAARRAGH
ncbi:hypothetical protein EDD28_3381 [Salana multivorans]|uniref:Uncharacterized protein n=1 Tax=Salana multivorans TaxID=120377 RepID=A0A3N2D2F6_9MICO|nr:hypothetical protein [Salana multivorans]ROR93952.1 hypothetical protein EDD28_3381 [Salana multivorans]